MRPGPFVLLVLALASWRTWVLVSRDSILDRVRDNLAPEGSGLRDFLECPYCAGFWCAGVWIFLWDALSDPVPRPLLLIAGWAALSAGVVFIEATHDLITGE